MTEDAGPVGTDTELVETGNFVFPEDGPQDDVVQTSLPDFDEDLVDGATLEDDE